MSEISKLRILTFSLMLGFSANIYAQPDYTVTWIPISSGGITIFVPLNKEPAPTVQFSYDARGRLIKVEDDRGRSVEYTLDAADNRTEVDSQ